MKLIHRAMQAIRFILTAISILLLDGKAISQNFKVDSIFWDDGNVSILSELDRVWIFQKKGNTIKDARIVEIKKDRGVLVYEKEKCLHDLPIANISKIQPGKFPKSLMTFQADNTPSINRIYERLDYYSEPDDFKCIVKTGLENNTAKTKALPKVAVTGNAVVSGESIIPVDTLIDEEGFIMPIKIISIENKVLNYKKASNPNGPIYVKPFENAIITKYANSSTINLNKNH